MGIPSIRRLAEFSTPKFRSILLLVMDLHAIILLSLNLDGRLLGLDLLRNMPITMVTLVQTPASCSDRLLAR